MSTTTTYRVRADWLTQPLSEQKQLAAGPPVDYSFKDLKTVLDLVMVEPTSGTARKPALPLDGSPLEYLEGLAAQDVAATADAEAASRRVVVGASPAALESTLTASSHRGSNSGTGTPAGGNSAKQLSASGRLASAAAGTGALNGTGGGNSAGAGGGGGIPTAAALGAKLNSNSLRLCNNHLMSLNGLSRVMRHVLDDATQLVWLDVSSNQLATIEDAVLEFPSLQVLYYHGNNITNINDVLKLQALPKLTKLTLHGNPISENKNYKNWVVAHLPGLRNMDFGPITKVERDKIDTWFKSMKKKH